MVLHVCGVCKKVFNKKIDYTRHISKTKPCENTFLSTDEAKIDYLTGICINELVAIGLMLQTAPDVKLDKTIEMIRRCKRLLTERNCV